jgi:hypothetical protein
MKKILIPIILAFSLLLMACNSNDGKTDGPDDIAANEFQANLEGLVNASMALANYTALETSMTVMINTGSRSVFAWEDIVGMLNVLALNDLMSPDDLIDFEAFSYKLYIDAGMDANNNAEIKIGLPANHGVVWFLEIRIIDEVVYIGLENLFDELTTAIENIPEFEDTEIINDFWGLGWIRLSPEELAGFTDIGIDPTVSVGQANITDGLDIESWTKLIEDIAALLSGQEYQVITEEMNVITRNDEWFILSANEVQAIAIIENLVTVLTPLSDELANIINNSGVVDQIAEANHAVSRALTGADIREMLQDIDLEELKETNFSFLYKVKADETSQSMTLAIDFPNGFDGVFGIDISATTTVKTGTIVAPANSRGLMEIIEEILASMFDPNSWSGDGWIVDSEVAPEWAEGTRLYDVWGDVYSYIYNPNIFFDMMLDGWYWESIFDYSWEQHQDMFDDYFDNLYMPGGALDEWVLLHDVNFFEVYERYLEYRIPW